MIAACFGAIALRSVACNERLAAIGGHAWRHSGRQALLRAHNGGRAFRESPLKTGPESIPNWGSLCWVGTRALRITEAERNRSRTQQHAASL